MSAHWRRWRPQGGPVETDTLPQQSGDMFTVVTARVKKTMPRIRSRDKRGLQYWDEIIQQAKQAAESLEAQGVPDHDRAVAWLYALAMQAPRAAEAQQEMDKHPHGYHNREKRLYELIDFNDTYDASVLAAPEDLLLDFPDRTKEVLDLACKRAGTRCFSNEQFEAITHGLSREIAVYKGVREEGYEAEMTNRMTDAFGIDMRIYDPKTLHHINVDVKTRSAYYHRIQELRREGRLSDEAVLMADRNGFTRVYNGHNGQEVPVVIWRIDEQELGTITAFQFARTDYLATMLRDIFSRYGA